MPPTYARRTDKNQSSIVDQLRKLGYNVRVTSNLGLGFPDILVRNRKKGIGFEIKVKGKAKNLTPFEIDMRDWLVTMGFRYEIVTTVEEILAHFEKKRCT